MSAHGAPWHVTLASEITVIDSVGKDVAIMSGDYDTDYERMADHATLTAAAPDLVEALQLLLKEMELSGNAGSKDYGWPVAITKSRAALAKAGVT